MNKTGITRILRRMTLVPIIVMGLVIAAFSTYNVITTVENEAEREMMNETAMALASIEAAFPGDYSSTTQGDYLIISKGDAILNDRNALFDNYKNGTGTDFTLFYDDVRILTTIYDDNGRRIVGSKANETVVNDVIKGNKTKFYNSVDVFGVDYFALYTPISNSDGKVVGMLAVLTPTSRISLAVVNGVAPVLILVLIATILASLWARSNAMKFRETFRKISDSLIKTSHGELSNSVDSEVLARKDEFSDIGYAIVDMQKSLRELVEIDVLTRLNNRRSGQQKLTKVIEKFKTKSEPYCVALGDIDFFKKFNDTYGHDCGDLVLQKVAMALKDSVKDNGFAIRWGGEEFLLVLVGMKLDEAEQLINSIIEKIRMAIVTYAGKDLSVTMTFGLVDGTRYTSTDDVVKAADDMLYSGKEAGRDRLVVER